MSRGKKLFAALGAVTLVGGAIALPISGGGGLASIINATFSSTRSHVIVADSGSTANGENIHAREHQGVETQVLMRDFAVPADSGVWTFRQATADNPVVASAGYQAMYLINVHYTGDYQNDSQWDGVSVSAFLPPDLDFALNDPSTLNVTCWFDNVRNRITPGDSTIDFLVPNGVNHAMSHGGCRYSPVSNKFYYQGGSRGVSSDVFTQNSDRDSLLYGSSDGLTITREQRSVDGSYSTVILPIPELPSNLHILVTGAKVSETALHGLTCMNVSASNAAESSNMNVVPSPREPRSPVQISSDSACMQINEPMAPTITLDKSVVNQVLVPAIAPDALETQVVKPLKQK